MRSRSALLAVLLAPLFFAVPHAAHAALPFWGPIIPIANDLCPAGWGMLIVVINNIIEFALTVVIVIVAPLTLAYAGFLFVVNPVNASGKEEAKSMMLNVVVGVVVALAAWLIVDAVMAALTPNGQPFGENWTTLISSGGAPECLTVAGALNQAPNVPGSVTTCPSGQTCQNGSCYPAPTGCGGTTCQNGQVCGTDGETCVFPAGVSCGSATCSPNQTCDTSSGTPTCKDPLACSTAGLVSGVGASGLNVSAAAAWLNANAGATSGGMCLHYVRQALSAGGVSLSCPHNGDQSLQYAGDCNGPLQSLGFGSLGGSDNSPQIGDIVVFSPTGSHTIGHIAMFTGSQWVSDFRQSTAENPPGCPWEAASCSQAVVNYWRP